MTENVAIVLNNKRSRVCEGGWVQTHQPEPEKECHLCLANSFFFFSFSPHRTPNLRGNKESRLPAGPSVCERIKERPVLTPCASLGKKPSPAGVKDSGAAGGWGMWHPHSVRAGGGNAVELWRGTSWHFFYSQFVSRHFQRWEARDFVAVVVSSQSVSDVVRWG